MYMIFSMGGMNDFICFCFKIVHQTEYKKYLRGRELFCVFN